MDKFVQLPFLIPPVEEQGLTRYTSSLFSTGDSLRDDDEVEQLASQASRNITSIADVPVEAERLQKEHNLDGLRATHLKDRLETKEIQRKLDEGINSFSDRNPEIRRAISTATYYFPGNPRELKRFINAFRFQYFLWWARRAQGLEGPTLDQLLRWTVLSMKWPEMVRWLRRSGGSDWRAETADGVTSSEKTLTASTRLKLIEEVSREATDIPTWHQQADDVLHLTPDIAPWLNDDELLQFFHEEATQYTEGQRLSDGAGKGLW